MSPNVRRLVFDFEPWPLAGAVLLTAFLFWDDWRVISNWPSAQSASFAAFIWLLILAQNKARAWKILPVSRRDVGQARWWRSLGLPALWLALTWLAAALAAMLK